MSVIINASTTSGLVMTSDLSGQLQFQNNGVNLPMGGVAPAFSAYQSSSQSIGSGTFTKIQFQTEDYDTNSNFDSTTNYRFTPTVAGYYQISGGISWGFTSGQSLIVIYKNSARFKDGSWGTGGASGTGSTVSSLVYFNGTTDQVELWVLQNTGNTNNVTAQNYGTYFNGSLVRGA
jgi:hypothetical protein